MPRSSGPETAWRELALVVLFAALGSLVFVGKAWTIDEPCFIAMARQILRDPAHPLAFSYNWLGTAQPMSLIKPLPPLVPYLVAPALALSGGREGLLRLLLLPFDLLAAASLYRLGARFLRRPLLPTLIVLAGPSWWLNVTLVTAEKWIAAFGLAAMALLVNPPDGEPLWFWLSAASLSLALLSKYSAAFLLAPALAWSWKKNCPPRRLTAYLAAAALPAALELLRGVWADPGRSAAVWSHTAAGTAFGGLGPAHTLRAFLAFTGGCVLTAGVWPLLGRGTKVFAPRAALFAAAAAAALTILFSPIADVGTVRLVDRLTGWLFACGALIALTESARREGSGEARVLWGTWILSAGFLQLFIYWSVVARFILFIVPPLTFAAAAGLERRLPPERASRVLLASLVVSTALSLGLGWVDARYADAQKDAARSFAAMPRPAGSRLWFTGHWGLQQYLEDAGAVGLDTARGGWNEVSAGDRVLLPTVNALVLRPEGPVRARVLEKTIDSALPLRLMSGWWGQGGFYSSARCFLPYSLSREPLDRFLIVEKF